MSDFPFSKNLFWDNEVEDIDLQIHKRYVIERVITRGSLNDFKALTDLYTHDQIIHAITQSKELDSKTAHFCSWYFNIPKTELHVSSFYR